MLNIVMSKLSLKVLLGVFALMFSASVGISADNYLCISKLSTGFKYKDGAWNTVNFREDKYIVSVEKRTVNLFGGQTLMDECNLYGPMLECSVGANSFYMTIDKLKYQRVNGGGGYLFDNRSGTPFIEIGTCSKF